VFNSLVIVFIGLNALDAQLTIYLVSEGAIESNWWRFIVNSTNLFWTIKGILVLFFIGLVIWLKAKRYKRLKGENILILLNIGLLLVVIINATNLLI